MLACFNGVLWSAKSARKKVLIKVLDYNLNTMLKASF
jgi:hypothetical protein